MSGQSKLLKAPAIFRSEMIFPYFGGLRLLEELNAAGGCDLVNKVFASPPDRHRTGAASG